MLAVAIETNRSLVALFERVAKPGLHGTSDADVERKPEDGCPVCFGDRSRLVARRVVDDDDLDLGAHASDFVDDSADGPGLVPGRDDGDEGRRTHAETRAPRSTSCKSRRARCAYVCSSRTRSRARRPRSSACAGSAIRSRYASSAASAVSTTTSSLPGSNQRSIPSWGFDTIAAPEDASSNGLAVDEPRVVACGRRVMFRLTRAAEMARANTLNGTSPKRRAAPVSPWKSRPPSAMSRPGCATRRLAHHRLHPVTSELVAVAVEEDVDLLLDVLRREELGVGAPVERLRPPRAELEQAWDPSLRIRDHEVVLPRIRAVVRVEPRVHPSVLGQAHRDVAVVEHDRDAVALAQRLRDTPEVRHRDGEHDHGVGPLRLDQALEVPLPTRRDPAGDRLSRELVDCRLVGIRLGPPKVAIALHARQDVSHHLIGLAFAKRRVRSDPPPG